MNLSIYEWIGYIGSAIVLISFMMTSVVKLRLVNMAGSVITMIYGFMIAVVNRISNYQISKKKMGCENCPSRSSCSGKECAEK